MFTQLAPALSHLRHWYVYVIVADPVHVPFAAVSVDPSLAVPEIVGSTEFAGAAPWITAVCALVAATAAHPDQHVFVPVTTTRIVLEMSAATSRYVLAVAPTMSTQLAPRLSHRRHWYVYEIADVPLHVPVAAVNPFPSIVTPLIDGSTEFTGGSPVTWAVCALVATADPPAFVAVTTTRIVDPISAVTCGYVEAVAPTTSTHAAPELSHRRH
jgi:hypothetical protein